MINRKTAEEVIIKFRIAELDLIDNQKVMDEGFLKRFLAQFPDEPEKEMKIWCDNCNATGKNIFTCNSECVDCTTFQCEEDCLICKGKGYTIESQSITPDQMLNEMREWARVNNCELRVNSIINDECECYWVEFDLYKYKTSAHSWKTIYLQKTDRKEAIAEAYRQWQQLTQKETEHVDGTDNK